MTRRDCLMAAVAGPLLLAAERTVEEFAVEAGGRVERNSWGAKATAEPVGSLVKIFTGLAYGTRFRQVYPVVECRGTPDGCWLAKGHGKLGYAAAIAQSCNAYFLRLARAVTHQDVLLVASQYHLDPPSTDTPEARIGIGRGWMATPASLAAAYLAVANHPKDPGVGVVLEGLRQCARTGTGKAAGSGVLAKTGTSVCVHRPASNGDGWAIGLYPEVSPRYAVLARVHGVPGYIAAESMAERIRR